jgi:hypothetical protein
MTTADEKVFDCGHTSPGLRKEVDILHYSKAFAEPAHWSTAILCRVCVSAINNNPDDPREVYPAGTREDQE